MTRIDPLRPNFVCLVVCHLWTGPASGGNSVSQSLLSTATSARRCKSWQSVSGRGAASAPCARARWASLAQAVCNNFASISFLDGDRKETVAAKKAILGRWTDGVLTFGIEPNNKLQWSCADHQHWPSLGKFGRDARPRTFLRYSFLKCFRESAFIPGSRTSHDFAG